MKPTKLTNAQRNEQAILRVHLERGFFLLLDLLNPAASLHQICQDHKVTLAQVKQCWLDNCAQLAMAAQHSDSILRSKNAFEQSRKHKDLMDTPGRYTGLLPDCWD